ncbi:MULTISPECIES: hypothetical protein [Sinorhizobium]|uniref:Uncharacterized protein n=1 Tax=Sinorhizobium americanum TaxID=194963 RepID=A0A2S3YKC5_9HYPH|nr:MULTISPECIES: hypothetical protein [Sinorhizobium]PDT41619.1 hypothetical protein CO656_12115 [Sinorhizobium sp. FG01]POH27814.1 hypothetical protein ATY31_21875 [Sinorhizobium americanum]
MNHAEEVIERAMAAVAAVRRQRERDQERRRQAFGRIQLGLPLPTLKHGLQLSLELDEGRQRRGTAAAS